MAISGAAGRWRLLLLGDDIYLALKEYPSASSTEFKRMNVYADWAVGKSWVDDVDIVYKKGQWKTDVAKAKNYITSGSSAPDDDLNGVASTSNKTEAASLIADAKAALEDSKAASKLVQMQLQMFWQPMSM